MFNVGFLRGIEKKYFIPNKDNKGIKTFDMTIYL